MKKQKRNAEWVREYETIWTIIIMNKDNMKQNISIATEMIKKQVKKISN